MRFSFTWLQLLVLGLLNLKIVQICFGTMIKATFASLLDLQTVVNGVVKNFCFLFFGVRGWGEKPHQTMSYHTKQYHVTVHFTTPHCTKVYHTTRHCNSVHHTIPHCTSVHHTAPLQSISHHNHPREEIHEATSDWNVMASFLPILCHNCK